MWKRALALTLVLVLVLGVAAQAAEMRKPSGNVGLSFNGTTAICTGEVRSTTSGDSISAVMKLWHRGRAIRTWPATGTTTVRFNESASVVSGQTYKVTLEYSVNGGTTTTLTSASKTCP